VPRQRGCRDERTPAARAGAAQRLRCLVHARVGVLSRIVCVSEEALAFRAEVMHLLVVLLETLACVEPLCASVYQEAISDAGAPYLAARRTRMVVLLEMAPQFVVVVKVYLAFYAIDVVATRSVVRFEAVLGIEDLYDSRLSATGSSSP
jgi:hypothetical protein